MCRARIKGFSLIEVIIVIFVIAIVTSGVAIAIGSTSSPSKRLFETGERLFAKMNFALDEALVQRRLIGLRINQEREKTSYSWHIYDNERWLLLQEPLSLSLLPEEMQVEVEIDNELLESLLENSLNSTGDNEQEPPAIIFYPNSDVSEFELSISLKQDEQVDAFRIFLDERGQLSHSGLEKESDKQ